MAEPLPAAGPGAPWRPGLNQRAAEGSGAAGGIGFGLRVVLGAILESGFDVVARSINLDASVEASDLVITSEGCLDLLDIELRRLHRWWGRTG